MAPIIPVAEIFGPTIQGEGPHVGMKTLFVRVVGCDFDCSWCDSKFAWKTNASTKRYSYTELSGELIARCQDAKCDNVVLTGGNPCLYNFSNVIDELHHYGITVDVETQGSKLPEWLSKTDLLVISPKAPSSQQPDIYDNIRKYLNESNCPKQIAIKIPIFDRDDFEFAKRYYKLIEQCQNLFYQIDLYLSVGNTNTTESGDISKRILTDYTKLIDMVNDSNMRRVFILPQVHTLIWGNKQGV